MSAVIQAWAPKARWIGCGGLGLLWKSSSARRREIAESCPGQSDVLGTLRLLR